MSNNLFIFFQKIVPQHLISRIVGFFARSKIKIVKNRFISFFIKNYDINMSEAVIEDPYAYESFNDFFTRNLKPGLRKFTRNDKNISCPVDGQISQIGSINKNKIIQAKGRNFSLKEFLGGDSDLENEFSDGLYATIYLSPKDYHRIHMPLSGTLRLMYYIPGDLFSVNQITVDNVDNLFARNERLVCVFDTIYGSMVITLVGAIVVAGIEVVWTSDNFKKNGKIQKKVYPKDGDRSITLEKGEQLGQFLLGSTVILCFEKDALGWNTELKENSLVKLGQFLGSFR